jgi:microcin C transport system substrate-binding protein
MTWRWVRWPEKGNARKSREPMDAHMFWIDEEVKRETKEAVRTNRDFGETLRVFDAYKSEQ